MPISETVQLGEDVRIFHPSLVNLYGCKVGPGTRIGAFVEIQKNASVGARCKISSHSFICEGVSIEEEVFVGHGVMFTNDRLPRATNADGSPQSEADWKVEPTIVRKRASIGSNVTIVAGVTIGVESLVGAGAVVTRDVPDYAIVAGVPARVIGDTRSERHIRGQRTRRSNQARRPGVGVIRIGVVGYGYWGPNLVRNFAETPEATLAAVADLDARKLEIVKRRYPVIKTTTRFQDLLEDPGIDAVAIATPVNTHFELGMAVLKAGKHLWLEKPMAETSLQARKLIDEADKRKLVLLVDHTFIYTGAVRKMAEIIKAGDLGRVYYYDSVRVNLGLFQRDVSVISDLAVHDFAILEHLLGEHPTAVSASGVNHFPGYAGEPGVHHTVL